MQQEKSILKQQIIPISLAAVVCAALVGVLFLEIVLLNRFTEADIATNIRWFDVLIGLTIYLKTSIDFAIYIGHLMDKNPGWKGRVAIEIGTAVGNAAGTLAVLIIWAFFKEVEWLLAIMIFLAALVLFKLAEDSLEHAKTEDRVYPKWFQHLVTRLECGLKRANAVIAPLLRYVIPNLSFSNGKNLPFWSLAAFSFTIPFILITSSLERCSASLKKS